MDPTKDLALSVDQLGIQLHKRFGTLGLKKAVHWAVEDVSFDLCKGEVLGIMGRNGSGKSTLLRSLAGIINPDRGRIRNYGHSTCLLSLAVGFMPQLTGRQNAILSGMLMGRTRKEMEHLLPEIVAFSEIGSWFDVPVSTYSSGMRQRMAFSVALHVQSDILLLDETLSVGDEVFRAKSKVAMREMIKSGRTVVLVSNNSAAIASYCDTAIWIESGRSVFQGDPEVVRQIYLEFSEQMRTKKEDLTLTQQIERAIDSAKG